MHFNLNLLPYPTPHPPGVDWPQLTHSAVPGPWGQGLQPALWGLSESLLLSGVRGAGSQRDSPRWEGKQLFQEDWQA